MIRSHGWLSESSIIGFTIWRIELNPTVLILVHKFHVFQFGTFLFAYKSKQGGHEILEGYFDKTHVFCKSNASSMSWCLVKGLRSLSQFIQLSLLVRIFWGAGHPRVWFSFLWMDAGRSWLCSKFRYASIYKEMWLPQLTLRNVDIFRETNFDIFRETN